MSCCSSHQKNLKNLSISRKMDKSDSAYKTIGEVAKLLNLKSNKNKSIKFFEE